MTGCYITSWKIKPRYLVTTLGLQTRRSTLPRIQPMDQQQDQEQENTEMLDSNIKEFIAATRQHLFQPMPSPSEPISIPLRTIH